VTDEDNVRILGLPGLSLEPLDLAPPISEPIYFPLPRNKEIPGFLVRKVIFGAFHAKWLVCECPSFNEPSLTTLKAYEYLLIAISVSLLFYNNWMPS